MKLIAPDYYKNFKCIAGECKHSCCIGWEIDVDPDTLSRYRSVSGEFGKRLSDNILGTGETACFVLTENERCPFLNSDNLCDIILTLGEDSLCQICADHPRYRNFFSDRVEVGLGMCCEAAAQLILTRAEPTTLITLDDDDSACDDIDAEFFALRSHLMDIVQDRSMPFPDRISKLLAYFDITLPDKTLSQWAEIYLGLEILDDGWRVLLNRLSELKIPAYTPEHDDMLEQLAVYFLFRHMADGLYDGRLRERAAFCAHASYMIWALSMCADDFVSAARMYSSEIEYSEDNMNTLLDIFA